KPILESDFDLAERDELTVWNETHPRPDGGLEFERRLMKLWADIVDSQLQGLLDGDQGQLAELRGILDSGWRVILGLTATDLTQAKPSGDEASHPNAVASIAFQAASLPAWQLRAEPPASKVAATE